MYLTCQYLAHNRCLIFPESEGTWVKLLWGFYLETSIPKEEEEEEKGREKGEGERKGRRGEEEEEEEEKEEKPKEVCNSLSENICQLSSNL